MSSPRRLPESARIFSNGVCHLARGAPLEIGVADDRWQRTVAEELRPQDEMEAPAVRGCRPERNAENVGEVGAGFDCQQSIEHGMAAAGERAEYLAAAAGAIRRTILAAVVETEEAPLRRCFGDTLDQLRSERGPDA